MPRLFTALAVPPEIGARLAVLRGGLPGARWVHPTDFHVTLSYIGDIETGLGGHVTDGLDSIRRPAFDVTLGALDAFGHRKPRSVHAVVTPTPALLDLQEAQDRLLRRLGVPVEPRAYVPHVTLARLGAEASARRVADWLALYGGFAPMTFTADAFSLFSARDSVGGGPYIVEARYALG